MRPAEMTKKSLALLQRRALGAQPWTPEPEERGCARRLAIAGYLEERVYGDEEPRYALTDAAYRALAEVPRA